MLEPCEVRMIAEGRLETLDAFAVTPRLHASDAKGDTPLHIAARLGNLALCDLFVRSGADAQARNLDGQTPADAAAAEGHGVVARLLEQLSGPDPAGPWGMPAPGALQAAPAPRREAAAAPVVAETGEPDMLDDLLLEPEEDAESFHRRTAGQAVTGDFIARTTDLGGAAVEGEADWEIDLSAAPVRGDGIGTATIHQPDRGRDDDFLHVRSRGRLSRKEAVRPVGTRLHVDPEACSAWAEAAVTRGLVTSDDIDALAGLCDGNGDADELRANLWRLIEAAGTGVVAVDGPADGRDIALRADTCAEDLAEAILAALSRATRLPGTGRFAIDREEEARMLARVTAAKRDLQVAMLGCVASVPIILRMVDGLRDGLVEPGFMTMRPVTPQRAGDRDTAAFFEAAEVLRAWAADGRVLEGRRRREALAALDGLDLTLPFHRAMIECMAEDGFFFAEAQRLDTLVSACEGCIEQVILSHLSFARKFSARRVEEGEDAEDVFQVAFLGLQRATRRFDADRGFRFMTYAQYWIRQTLDRWRADDRAIVRLPVHLQARMTALDEATERLEGWLGRAPTVAELALDLEWEPRIVEKLQRAPRHRLELTEVEEEHAPTETSAEQTVTAGQTERLIDEALADLPEREAEIIRMRFGIGHDSEMTLEEIGQLMGVTRERIRQIEAKALARLRHPARLRHLRHLLGA